MGKYISAEARAMKLAEPRGKAFVRAMRLVIARLKKKGGK